MRILFFTLILFFSYNTLYACSGDCVACHPVLQHLKTNKKDHKILDNCKKCHIDGTKIIVHADAKANKKWFEIVKADTNTSSSHTECGADCFSCHPIEKVQTIDIPEHKALGACIECHIALDKKKLFNLGETDSQNTNEDTTLRGILGK